MNIREIQSATIVDLLADETDNSIEKLNKISFKKTVDISAITKIIEDCVAFKTNESSSIDDEKSIDARYIYEQIANAYDAVKKCPEHEKCFEEISEIANKLGENVVNIFNIFGFFLVIRFFRCRNLFRTLVKKLSVRHNYCFEIF